MLMSHIAAQIYTYPTVDEKTGELITAERLQVAPGVQLLYDYIRQRGTIVPITDFRRSVAYSQPRDPPHHDPPLPYVLRAIGCQPLFAVLWALFGLYMSQLHRNTI